MFDMQNLSSLFPAQRPALAAGTAAEPSQRDQRRAVQRWKC